MTEVAEATFEAKDAPGTIVSPECEERQPEPDHAVEQAIRRRIEKDGRYAFYFRQVTCQCSTGVLKVCGRVPTTRLKDVLWSLIRDLDDITEIDDQLDVISSTGLSSVRPRSGLVNEESCGAKNHS